MDANPGLVDICERLQVPGPAQRVLVLRRPLPPRAVRSAELDPICRVAAAARGGGRSQGARVSKTNCTLRGSKGVGNCNIGEKL